MLVVPDVNAARPKSFLGIYYGKKAERNEFRGTTGENVKLYLLDSQVSAGSVTKKNSFIRNVRFDRVVLMKWQWRLVMFITGTI